MYYLIRKNIDLYKTQYTILKERYILCIVYLDFKY